MEKLVGMAFCISRDTEAMASSNPTPMPSPMFLPRPAKMVEGE
jgi:hypothetical protein